MQELDLDSSQCGVRFPHCNTVTHGAESTPLVVKYAEQRERSAWPGYSGYDYWGHAPGLPMYVALALRCLRRH